MTIEFAIDDINVTFIDDYFDSAELYIQELNDWVDITDVVLQNPKLQKLICDKYFEQGGHEEMVASSRENDLDQ